nr:DUF1800 family protein [Chiayiivirga flava]
MSQVSTSRRLRRTRAFVLGACACITVPAIAGPHLFGGDFEGVADSPASEGAASRFLTQTTFGPTLPEIDRLVRIGHDAWLAEQFAAPASLQLPYLDARINAYIAAGQPVQVYQDARQEIWFRNALRGNDQLRQRVAFALSEIFVISDQNGALEGNPTTMAQFYDLLATNAFGNYRTLLEQVTLHPAMGHYLSMFKNRKPDEELNIRPDENYAREIMQLFSVGLVMLNPDGTPVDGDPGEPGVQTVPTYDQDTIRGFAHVFTGWNFSTCEQPTHPENDGQFQWWFWEYCPPAVEGSTVDWLQAPGWRTPMVPWGEGTPYGNPRHAVAESKQLLVYPGVSPANGLLLGGGSARADLAVALDNVFRHPNVGPFFGRLLIQRLVTSNPSPAYVGRVAAVFANNGSGVRGDLRAVVRSIVMDPEARSLAAAPAHAGKLREPLLRLTQLWRALDARSNSGSVGEGWPEYALAQAVQRSPTVFNFFLPNYQLPGEIANAGLFSPEFQITTDTYITRLSNDIGGKIYWAFRGNPWIGEWDPMQIELAPYVALAEEPGRMLDRIDLLFLGRRMSMPMYDALKAHAEDIDIGPYDWAESGEWRANQMRERAQDMLWLTLTSPEYVVEK